MAMTLITPVGGEFFYAHYNGVDMNTINNVIQFQSTVAENVTIAYSIDSGSNWTAIDTVASPGTGATETYNWSLDTTEWAAILTANEIETMQIKVTGAGGSNDASDADFTMRKVSFSSLKPNHTSNVDPINSKSTVNITWSESYVSGIAAVLIEYLKDGGSWTTLVASTTNDGTYLWHPEESPTEIYSADEDNMQLRISAVDSGHTNNIYYSENADDSANGFEIIVEPEDQTGFIADGMLAPERLETFNRVAMEKGILPDEGVVVTQLEAGEGVILRQRDYDGKLDPGDPILPYKAWNIVVDVEENVARRPLRQKQGVFNMISSGVDASATKAAGDYYYGTLMSFNIAHNWSLGDAGHACFMTGQTQNSWHLEIRQIVGITSSDVDKAAFAQDVIPFSETINRDTIVVYCSIKGADNDPRGGGSADDHVTLAKDRLGFDAGTYTFEWRLTEVAPFATTC